VLKIHIDSLKTYRNNQCGVSGCTGTAPGAGRIPGVEYRFIDFDRLCANYSGAHSRELTNVNNIPPAQTLLLRVLRRDENRFSVATGLKKA
jgi:hypothetical protein